MKSNKEFKEWLEQSKNYKPKFTDLKKVWEKEMERRKGINE